MSLPTNITKLHLLQAIDKIDTEGIPSDADSQYYDVVYQGKTYPPKVIVSLANFFANGIELDRRTFSGGIATPCFKLLETNGFEIKPKQNTPIMNKIKIYKVSSTASPNAQQLRSPEGQYFYWNDTQFRNNEVGDFVFVMDKTAGWALFTKIGVKDIIARYNSANNTSSFNHANNTYTVNDPDGRYEKFIRMDIIKKVDIPIDWSYTTQIGVGETYDIWKPGITDIENRIEKIVDLEKLFPDDDAYDVLEEARLILNKSLDQDAPALNQDIIEAIASEGIQSVINDPNFTFQLALEKWNEVKAFVAPNTGFYEKLLDDFAESNLRFTEYYNRLNTETAEYRLLSLLAQFISYCDFNAANKNELNQYEDKRTIAKANIPQNEWIAYLLQYKMEGSNPAILSPAIKFIVEFIETPQLGFPMVSTQHRNMLVKYLLKSDYKAETFVDKVRQYFAPYQIQPKNKDNLNRIIAEVLYRFPKVKKLWFERVLGLAAIDTTGWQEDETKSLKTGQKSVHWWSRVISNKGKVSKLLDATLQNDGHFYFYYMQNNMAKYRMRVIDYADHDNYISKKWNENGDVKNYRDDINTYRDGTQQAKIVFLADEFIKLKNPIPVESFDFYGSAPRQFNLEGYSEVNSAGDEIMELATLPTSNTYSMEDVSFNYEWRKVLKAIQTKPFILLAGISGTGKSRLVRTLAYKTCCKEPLQGNSPGNFLLIKVRPNWHDSTELIGYITRISGIHYTVTEFMQFVVNAWKNLNVPFFLCLDEMNLAPVEQYFAEYLSIVETRDFKNGFVKTDTFLSLKSVENKMFVYEDLLTHLGVEKDSALWNQFVQDGIGLPNNLIVMGTVNMDETTHSFSRKVLDRAMTIEMNNVNLKNSLEEANNHWKYPDHYFSIAQVTGTLTSGGAAYTLFKATGDEIIEYLETVNEALDKTPFKIAYRVRDEFLIYCYQNSTIADKPNDWLQACLDEMTCMKILSRIEGDQTKVENVLNELEKILDDKYPHSKAKLAEMKDRLTNTGYTSFWA